MSNLSAGVLRSRKTSRTPSQPEPARAGGLGAHTHNRLAPPGEQHPCEGPGCTSSAVLGSEAPCFARTEPHADGQARTTRTLLLSRQRILLGRGHSLRPQGAMERCTRLRFLEWPRLEHHRQPRKIRRQLIQTTRPCPIAACSSRWKKHQIKRSCSRLKRLGPDKQSRDACPGQNGSRFPFCVRSKS